MGNEKSKKQTRHGGRQDKTEDSPLAGGDDERGGADGELQRRDGKKGEGRKGKEREEEGT
jgi:hypothetical protein